MLDDMATTVPRGTGRAALLEAAKAELVERSGALEVASVAERAGVSVGLIYRHFGSKAGLLSALMQDFYDRMDAEVLLVDPLPGASWAERERRRTELSVAFHFADPLAPVLLGPLARSPEVAAVEVAHLQRQVELATRNIARGQRDEDIPADLDPGIAGAMVMGGLRSALAEVLARRGRPRQDVIADQLWRLVVAAVRCKETET
jgi:AcrR family transcriptional regulator